MIELDKLNINEFKISSLAFLGDSIFDVLVKKYIVCSYGVNSKKLHETAIKYVCCQSQSKYIKHLLPYLTAQEISIYKRGRNYHPAHIPKKANCYDYHEATALEALFGYLYLTGNKERLYELFDIIVAFIEAEEKGLLINGNCNN